MLTPASKIRADFDRIADLSDEGWDHNSHYHDYLLRQAPAKGAAALEVGCGTGAFARLLARRFERVLGLDLSPRMIEIARQRSRDCPNVEYQVSDVTACDLGAGQFDCIASIATLHHMEFEPMLVKLKEALKPGGALLALDLYHEPGLVVWATAPAAFALSFGLRLLKQGRAAQTPAMRAAFAEHGRTDRYLALSHVRRACAVLLPGAQVRRHLLWRYSIVWRKPAAQP